MGAIASQITSLTIVYSTVYSDADQRKHQISASLAFVRAGNSPGTGEFPAQIASIAENVSIWWRHHAEFCMRSHEKGRNQLKNVIYICNFPWKKKMRKQFESWSKLTVCKAQNASLLPRSILEIAYAWLMAYIYVIILITEKYFLAVISVKSNMYLISSLTSCFLQQVPQHRSLQGLVQNVGVMMGFLLLLLMFAGNNLRGGFSRIGSLVGDRGKKPGPRLFRTRRLIRTVQGEKINWKRLGYVTLQFIN